MRCQHPWRRCIVSAQANTLRGCSLSCLYAANTLIKLPARKFSQREREMLFGAGAPNDFFYQGEGSWIAPAAGFGIVVAAVVYVGMLRAGRKVLH